MGEKQKNPRTFSSEMGSEVSMCSPMVIPYLLGSTGAGKRHDLPWAEASADTKEGQDLPAGAEEAAALPASP